MISLSLLFAHFVGDGLLQSDYMAVNKSKSFHALYVHAIVYSLCFVYWGVWFFLITLVCHAITDYFTSRCTSKLWFFNPLEATESGIVLSWHYVPNRRHWFFVMILFDQFLHFTQLALTAKFLGVL